MSYNEKPDFTTSSISIVSSILAENYFEEDAPKACALNVEAKSLPNSAAILSSDDDDEHSSDINATSSSFTVQNSTTTTTTDTTLKEMSTDNNNNKLRFIKRTYSNPNYFWKPTAGRNIVSLSQIPSILMSPEKELQNEGSGNDANSNVFAFIDFNKEGNEENKVNLLGQSKVNLLDQNKISLIQPNKVHVGDVLNEENINGEKNSNKDVSRSSSVEKTSDDDVFDIDVKPTDLFYLPSNDESERERKDSEDSTTNNNYHHYQRHQYNRQPPSTFGQHQIHTFSDLQSPNLNISTPFPRNNPFPQLPYNNTVYSNPPPPYQEPEANPWIRKTSVRYKKNPKFGGRRIAPTNTTTTKLTYSRSLSRGESSKTSYLSSEVLTEEEENLDIEDQSSLKRSFPRRKLRTNSGHYSDTLFKDSLTMSTPALEQQEVQTRPIMSMHGPSKSLDSTFVRNGQRSPIVNQESSDNMCMLEDSSADEASFEDIKSPHSDTDQTYSLIDIKSLGNILENGHFDCPDEPEAKAPSLPGRPNGSVMIPSVSIDEPSHSPDLSELLRTPSTKPSLFNKRDEKCRSQIFETSFKSPKQYLSSSTCNLADLSDGINEVDAEFEGLPGPSNFNGGRKFSFIPDEVTHELNSNNKGNSSTSIGKGNLAKAVVDESTLQGGVTKNGSKGKLVGKDKSIVKPAKTGAFSLFNKFKQQKDPVASLIKQTGAPKPATISGATSSRITASLKEVSGGDHRYSTLPEAKKNKSSVELQAIGSNLIEGLPDAMKSAIGQAITPTGSLKAKQRDSRTSISEHKISVSSSFIEQKMAVIGEEMLQCERWAHLFSSWAPEDISWRKMPACKKLSTSESKKQNIIREFISTERNHCYVLIILQQYFYANLKKERIFLNDTDMPFIAPAVIETLLKFHLELCQKLKNRMEENVVIDTISDIVLGEMKNEGVIGNVIKAYTDFCSSKEESKRLFNFNKTKSQKFKDYVHRYDSDPKYKAKDFKSCLDLVAHRLTKYPLLLDAIMKAEKNEILKEEAGLAAEAARQLTSQVDDDLNKCEINKRWDSIRQSVDRNSVGQFEGATFTLHDLLFQDPNDPRKVLCIGKVTYKALNGSKNDLILVLFDDILVFFLCKNSKVYFFDLDQHQAIFGIEKTLVRVIERQNSIAIVYNDKANMDMTTVSFSNKADLEQWTTALLTAKKQPIGYVRKAPNNATGCYMDRVLTNTSAADLHSFGLDGETLQKYNIWWAVTEKLFAKRQLDDEMFGKYVVERINWFQELKKHIVTMPFAKARQIPLKTMQALYDKFDELNRVKITDGEEYVAVMKRLEKEDVKALFDSWNGIFGKDDSDDSDCSSSRGKCVKRVSTYGGESDKIRRKDIVDKIRRHTTVPEIKSELRGIYPTSGDLATFAAIKGDASRKAAEMVLSENILMRSELIKLRNDLAKAELQKEAIKNSKGADFFSNTDEMEKLRTKNNEVFERERKFYIMQEKWTREAEEREEACRKRVEEREEACRKIIEEHEEAHKKREQTILLREADIDEKWLAAYKNRGNPSNTIYSDSDFPTSPLTPDPEMTGLPGPGIYEQPISKPLSHSKDGLRPHLSSSRSDLTRSASALSKNHKLGTHFLFHNHSDNTQQPSSNPTTSSKQLMSLVSKSETVTTKTKKK